MEIVETEELKNLLKELADKDKKEVGYKAYFDWVRDYWTSRGTPLDLAKHKYLEQTYKDQSDKIVFMKSGNLPKDGFFNEN